MLGNPCGNWVILIYKKNSECAFRIKCNPDATGLRDDPNNKSHSGCLPRACIPDTIRKARKGGNTGIRSNTTHFRNYEFTNPKRDEDSSCWCCLKKHNIYYYISDQIIKLALVEPC